MTELSNKIRTAKLVMVGDTSVGKSSICIRFARGSFSEYLESTIGAAFFCQSLTTEEGSIKFEIWDTAGQERYHALMPMYYHGAAAAIVVFDITRYDTFERAKMWIKELKDSTKDDCVITLVANKIDKQSERDPRADPNLIDQFVESNDLLYVETSAKTNVNIRQLFAMIANSLLKLPLEEEKDPFILDDPADDGVDKKCCVIL
mmetsp:Transcript_5706/g.9557  ORF Transcript_5706/g.9557 Transcript_5706/m.9557 type:complete len:204 (+) Transcript_5706:87-698(+)|eukprot:CAMPEP_0197042372 /NCGR_PEP_ID=MMETSP1384-20130603/18760_1 /TAXON_ID=29189 /ORGANISM="Ammonia sp." /LENGTH=203 /DNA_ID=CAMNT_0042473465 /DNA_START=71 /DNA_END=682 /DNA_ORIENTATION=-